MNDRGLSLTPLDMLKGYVLANVANEQQRIAANVRWKDNVAPLVELGKEEDSDAVKAWLRSQYADSIRERKKNASPRDFDRIGTEFHRWVKESDEKIGLTSSSAFVESSPTFSTFGALPVATRSSSAVRFAASLPSVPTSIDTPVFVTLTAFASPSTSS